MNIHICIFGYGLPDDLLASFASANQDDTTWHLFLHSRNGTVVEACEQIAKHKNVVYYPYGENRGCARSINEALIAAQNDKADAFLIWADDLSARPGDIRKIADTVIAHPECALVESMGWVERTGRTENLALTGGALNLRAVEKIGYLDQNFHPMYFDDIDWMYRASLVGMGKVTAQDTYLTHAGSKTHTHVQPEAFERLFYPNRDYYVRKWGGDGHQEQFKTPFNDPKYSIVIERENVNNPYPEYARSDIELS